MSSPQLLSLLLTVTVAVAVALLSPLAANAHPCSKDFAEKIQRRMNFQSCSKKALKAELAWNFNPRSRQLDIAFGAKLRHETGWVAWGLNPHGPQMVGTRALIGIKPQSGSLECYKYNITDTIKTQSCPLLPSDNIGLNVTKFTFEYLAPSQYYVILATIFLPAEFNSSRTNVVWQIGEATAGTQPLMHPKTLNNFDSTAILDLESFTVISYAHKRRHLRIAHGILSMSGWGSLLPSGVIVARYMRIFPKPWPRWYDVHVSCQTAGYVIGSSGWAIGMWLGRTSKHYSFNMHQTIGWIIFIFTTIQMLAWRLRPAPNDEYRTCWNMYHHFLGYAMLALISVNIFVGIKILEPEHVWKWAYIGLLGGFATLVLAFEFYGWIRFLLQK